MTDLDQLTVPSNAVQSTTGEYRSLRSLLDESLLPFTTVRLASPAQDAVVLARRDQTVDVVLDSGFVRTVYSGDDAQRIDDPARQVELLHRALRTVQAQATTAHRTLQEETTKHAETLSAIRAYAISKHRSSDICRRGLDDFLDEFDMDSYEPQVRVTFTITGSYLVDSDNTDQVSNDAHNCLTADLSNLDDVVDDSQDISVNIDDVTAVGFDTDD